MRTFEQVVAQNGFAAGARKRGLSPWVVTRLIGDLEDQCACGCSSARHVGSGEPDRIEEVGVALVLCRNDHDAVRRSTVKGVGISIASRRYMPTRTRACLDHLIRPETLAVDGVLPGEHP